MARMRVQVDHHWPGGARTTVIYLDERPPLSPAEREAVDAVLEEAIAALSLPRADAIALIGCELTEQIADHEAYEREAARRGVLAL